MLKKISPYLFFPALVLALVLSLGFGFDKAHAADSHSISIQDQRIDTVDGEKYSPVKHKNIASMVIENTNQGVKILGFSTKQKYETYIQQYKAFSPKSNDAGILAPNNYFYKWPGGSTTPNNPYRTLEAGHFTWDVSNRWGSDWNNSISSIRQVPYSVVQVWEWPGFEGQSYTFINNISSYVLWNDLDDFKSNDGKTWNNRVTSIKTSN